MRRQPVKRTVRGRIQEHDDLFQGIIRIARENRCMHARITGSGTVRSATLVTYDQKSMTHSEVVVPEPMEILSMYGTVTERDGEPLPHVHLVLSDQHGNGKGGHLLPGSTPVVDCEIVLEPFIKD
ncbi:MAG: DNA-binding protein [Ignavibacteria bacterium]|nr:DNA-binding protein [Ignavibacteria bacterium]